MDIEHHGMLHSPSPVHSLSINNTNRYSFEIGIIHVSLYGFTNTRCHIEVCEVGQYHVGLVGFELLLSLVQGKCHRPHSIVGEANVCVSNRVGRSPVCCLWIVLKLFQVALVLLLKQVSGGLQHNQHYITEQRTWSVLFTAPII